MRSLGYRINLRVHSSALVDQCLSDHFPVLKKLYQDTSAFWAEKSPDGLGKAPFGSYFSMAINVDLGAQVSSIPHRDMKNLSVGLCVIFVFGRVPSRPALAR